MQIYKRNIGSLFDVADDAAWLACFPRSGNTWVRFMLASYILDKPATWKQIDRIIPAADYRNEDFVGSAKVIKTHDPVPNLGVIENHMPVIYIVRDPRDVMASFYHYRQATHPWFFGDMTFSEFLRCYHAHYPGPWSLHVQTWLASHERVYMVKYEDMLDHPSIGEQGAFLRLNHMLSFLGIEIKLDRIKRAVDNCTFDRLKAKGPYPDDENFAFFRKGKIDDWRNYFSKDDHDYFMEEVGPTMKRLGYLTDWGKEDVQQ